MKLYDILDTNLIHAFIVTNNTSSEEGVELNERTVKNFCSKYLPRYMVPAFITFLSEVPETHNGKVDRVKLKKIAIER